MRTLIIASCLALGLVACNERPRMTVDPNPVTASTTVWARFDRPINGRATDQYWIVIAPAGAAGSYRDGREHVPRNAEGMKLQAPPAPGDYEVRLHGDWPKREDNVVSVVQLRVLPTSDVVGAR